MELDTINYEHRQSNFIDAKLHAMKLLSLLKGCINVAGSNVDVDVGAVLANIGSAEMQDIEKFIIKYVVVMKEGKPVVLSEVDTFNAHFNAHRNHYFALIVDGIKFHFADFLPGGLASSVNMSNLKKLMA